ncbi:glutamate racemase [bacterium]|nr:glutamate racemase [bacterium]
MNSLSSSPIGIFDSGVGGLTVAAEVIKELPLEDIVYFGDVARTPYGSKSRETVTRFSCEIVRFLIGQGVKLIIVACNTASSVALDVLKKEFDLPIIGVIRAGTLAALRTTENNKVGVIGTSATIASGSYLNDLKALAPDIAVISQACPLFVPLVEEGWVSHRVTTLVAKEYLSPLKDNGVDTLILGCTHYPFLKPVIAETMGKGVRLIDSAIEVAGMTKEILKEKGLLCQENKDTARKFYLSDTSTNFIELGERLLGEKMRVITRVDVSEYA